MVDISILITALFGFLSTITVALFTYISTRKKNNTDAFSSLISANEQFREEVRKDLVSAKAEKEEYKKLIMELKDEIEQYKIQILELRDEILIYKNEIMIYQQKVLELRMELDKSDEKK